MSIQKNLSNRAHVLRAVVGIGASAGGLSALQAFFTAIPKTFRADVAFVVVQHLSSGHSSLLTSLLQKMTHLQVIEADSQLVEGGHVYVIQPDAQLTISAGRLILEPRQQSSGAHRPIDAFFTSLAEDQRERAVSIVLSGTGSDGAAGLTAVKAEGGLAIAQTPESCEYDGMPRNAIATGLVDLVLAPAEMPGKLATYLELAPVRQLASSADPIPSTWPSEALRQILLSLRFQTGHDFSRYKTKTIVRRLERRLAVHQITKLEDYARFLDQNTAEGKALFRDLLIGVTSFFRDPKAFQELEEIAIPRLLAAKMPGDAVRVWIPACSTGEEAYSIAMLLEERMVALNKRFRVQIFATDIDAEAVERARSGRFPAGVAEVIPEGRTARFFTPLKDSVSGDLLIGKPIRSMLVFSEHDVMKDPPFSRLDLISCRNLMIYLGAEAQAHLIRLFHYGLNPGGYLFLGSSETAANPAGLFTPTDRKSKLYVRNEDLRNARLPLAPQTFSLWPRVQQEDGANPGAKRAELIRPGLREQTEAAILQHCGSVGVLVDAQGEILYVHGRTGSYLEPSPGEAGMNVLRMAREGLRPALIRALHAAATERKPASEPDLRVKTNGGFSTVQLTVVPVSSKQPGNAFVVILDARPGSAPPAGNAQPLVLAPGEDESSAARIVALMQELKAKDEYLRTSTDELAAANEELRSSNEEMQSVNEELQAANEELETSKEELQSVNEELATVNAELQQNLRDLSRANNDMNNLLAGTDIGTIFVDHQLRILRFTPAATRVVNLIAADVGRPVGHIVSNLPDYKRLVEDVQETLDTLKTKEVEVRGHNGAWYLLRIRPYRTLENIIEGAVITFTDITALKRSQDEQHELDAKCMMLFHAMPQAGLFFDADGRISDLNPAGAEMLGLNSGEMKRLLSGELPWAAVLADGSELAWKDHPACVALATGKPAGPLRLGFRVAGKNEVIWVQQDALPLFRPGADKPFQAYSTLVKAL